jgi:hypothetical protein
MTPVSRVYHVKITVFENFGLKIVLNVGPFSILARLAQLVRAWC